MRIYVFLVLAVVYATQPAAAQPRKLSLHDAIQSALESNADIRIAEEQQVQAGALQHEQAANLLPQISGTASYVNQTINLRALGIGVSNSLLPASLIPSVVGPFSIIDARVQYSQPVLDFSLIKRYQSFRRSAGAADFETQAVRNRVAAMVAGLYFNVQRAHAMTESAQAQVDLDDNLLKLARDRREFGTGTGLDVTRAEARLATDRHRLLQAQDDVRTAQLQLLRAMGERPNTQFDLTDSLSASVLEPESPDNALALALRNRPEVKAFDQRVQAARLAVGESKAESLPSLQAFGNYGDNGTRQDLVPTDAMGVQLQLPLFDSGRRSAHRQLSESQLKQAEIRAKDLRDQIELDVRVAVDNLASNQEQLRAAEEALRLAQEETDLARLRFEAQVTTQIDVVNAQAELAEARSRQVNALFALKSAEIEYQRATGLEIR
jgi:outer membrane protein TolC